LNIFVFYDIIYIKKGRDILFNINELCKELNLEIKKGVEYNPKIIVELEGDCNDGDYNITKTTYGDNCYRDIDSFKKLIKLLNEHFDDLFSSNLRDIEAEWFDDFLSLVNFPHNEWDICHSLTNFKINYIDETGTYILDIIFSD
jgi:hypothetical protein